MRSLFISPHCDDETLFGAFTIIREPDPTVLVMFAADDVRREESEAAVGILTDEAVAPMLLRNDEYADMALLRPIVKGQLLELEARDGWGFEFDRIYAPAIENGGHRHHNLIGELAREVFPGRVEHYMTYTNRGKSIGVPVPCDGAGIAKKLRALACYSSQISQANQVEHFLRDQREYYQQ